MLIDGFTVGAQIVNVLVLIWLLRRFLYGPITRAMAARQQHIDDTLAAAATQREQAAAEHAAVQSRAAALAAEHEQARRALHHELDEQRRAAIEQTRAEVEALRERWRASVADERDGFLLDLRQRTAAALVDAVRAVLRDLADEELEARVVARFVRQLDDLDDTARATLAAAAQTDTAHVQLRSAAPLPDVLRAELDAAMRGALGAPIHLDAVVDERLIGGIELRAGGFALAWSIDAALADLQDELDAALNHGGGDRVGG